MSASSTAALVARLDRLPSCRYFYKVVALIAIGGWFEFYELFMPGGIALGLIRKSHIYTASHAGMFALDSFATFLATFFLGMFVGAVLFTQRQPSRPSGACGTNSQEMPATAGSAVSTAMIAKAMNRPR